MSKLSASLLAKVEEITDEVCNNFINDEYAKKVKDAVLELAHLPETPLVKGSIKSWACGVTTCCRNA